MTPHSHEFARSLFTDAITDARGHLVPLAQRSPRLVALLVSHANGDRTLYDLATFLAGTELRAELRKTLRYTLAHNRFSEMQRYRLEYVLRMLEAE